ncbi:unnamed protein product [Lactuca saligna]|uniref:Protein kinase domain-containing protein n=1 Tax=Lactuca saligna TaxID=75948 RepID=A0AA36ECV3_LACSI|nr:unnamed protein product [Lactuca saligna]
MEAFLEEFQHLKFHLDEIKLATKNFDNNNVIGKGGFGYVYKGVLSQCEGQDVVAFKRLDRGYGHENLISLLGFCDEDGEKILVYKHASHRSLDIHLNNITLTWGQRLKIFLEQHTFLATNVVGTFGTGGYRLLGEKLLYSADKVTLLNIPMVLRH